MNKRIKELLDEVDNSTKFSDKLRNELQVEYNKVFDDSTALRNAIENAQNASMYEFDKDGEIVSWFRFASLNDYLDCQYYFENWIADQGLQVDWINDCLMNPQGESIVIQDDTRHDNGVWLNHKLIIPESEYKADNEIDEVKRNELIEAYMEKSGYYPGVFRADQHGNVFFVNTKKK